LRILFLTQIIPFPPDSGPKVKTYHVLRYLKERGHQVYLASFVRSEEEVHIAGLKDVCDEIYRVPIHRSRVADGFYWLRSHLSGRPFLIERDDLAGMRQVVARVLAEKSIDCIHADQLTMVQFGLPPAPLFGRRDGNDATPRKKPLLVFDAHNATWTIVERMRQAVPFFLRPVLSLEARRVKYYEGQIVRRFDHTLAVTDIDERDLLEALRFASQTGGQGSRPPAITITPIAVDTGSLQPVQRKAGSRNIITLGTLHYPPNADGIRWFVREVFPAIRSQVPDVTLTIAGKNPPPDFQQLAEQHAPAIQITGYVPDLQPLMESAALMVVPVRAGSGMRVRILEAFARAMPVVTTTIGLEGINARPGEDVIVADTPEDFATAVVALLQDPHLQNSLAQKGRALAENEYDWRVALQRMDKVYGTA
jgi:glycosyltransferase involved in cell wall biosynthesis